MHVTADGSTVEMFTAESYGGYTRTPQADLVETLAKARGIARTSRLPATLFDANGVRCAIIHSDGEMEVCDA